MKEINHTVVMAPKKRGDILIENAAGTGVSVIATRDIAIKDIAIKDIAERDIAKRA